MAVRNVDLALLSLFLRNAMNKSDRDLETAVHDVYAAFTLSPRNTRRIISTLHVASGLYLGEENPPNVTLFQSATPALRLSL